MPAFMYAAAHRRRLEHASRTIRSCNRPPSARI